MVVATVVVDTVGADAVVDTVVADVEVDANAVHAKYNNLNNQCYNNRANDLL